MRKHTARHWLHATLDLLPVILIPVFMIYSHRHDLSTDITIQQDVYKDFYQVIKNGLPNSTEYWQDFDNSTLNYNNEYLVITKTSNVNEMNGVLTESDYAFNDNDVLYLSFYIDNLGNENGEFSVYNSNDNDLYFFEREDISSIDLTFYSIRVSDVISDSFNLIFEFYSEANDVLAVGIKDVQFFNLTQIFGSGNEPTKEVFESYLTQDYYDFGSNQVKVGTIDVQAKNNDIMSVFMDSFNNSVNKYFNMGNVFNMTSVYNWFNTNIFGGTAPVVIYSVWNIVLYEFVMDLLFLLYGLFMWFIDMCKRLIEKPLDSIK